METNFSFTIEDIKRFVSNYTSNKYGNSVKCEVTAIKVITDESNNLISGNISINIDKE